MNFLVFVVSVDKHERRYSLRSITLTIFNLNSQALITKYLNDTKTVIDLSNLKKGSYILKITNDNYIEVKKIIKE